MKDTSSRKPKWPKHINRGNVKVTIYKRTTPNGKTGFMLAYLEDGKRKFDSYPDEATAVQNAEIKASRLSTLGVKAGQLTEDELRAYVASMDTLKPLNISVGRAVSKLLEAVEIVGKVENIVEACKFYRQRHKAVIPKRVADCLAEMLKIKEADGAAPVYIKDLRNRLKRFADAFQRDACNVSTVDIQAWFDAQKFKPVNFMTFRRAISVLFTFCVQRGYALDNPCEGVETKKIKGGETEIYTPNEIRKLLLAASPEYQPALAIGAFAGLRSAEIERLDWAQVHLDGTERFIEITAGNAKTAARRVVPISDNLAAWLIPYAGRTGKVWKGTHAHFYIEQADTAKAAGLTWKSNALRHSFCSYRLAGTQNAAQVALEAGNSPQMIFRHYHAVVRLAEAVDYFSVKPDLTLNDDKPQLSSAA